MEAIKTKSIHRAHINTCRNCRLASLCLPGPISKQAPTILQSLEFNSRLLNPGEHLHYQGDSNQQLYLLRSGMLKSYHTSQEGEQQIMQFHFPPDLFGWEAIDPHQKSFAICAIDFTNVCEMSLKKMQQLLNNNEVLFSRILALINRRIQRDNSILFRNTAQQRVASFILELADHYREMGYPYYLCKLVMTHQDIANYLRIAPETMSRVLHQFKKKKYINITQKSLYVLDQTALSAIANNQSEMAR